MRVRPWVTDLNRMTTDGEELFTIPIGHANSQQLESGLRVSEHRVPKMTKPYALREREHGYARPRHRASWHGGRGEHAHWKTKTTER